MIQLSDNEKRLLIELLRASNSSDNLAQLFDKADSAKVSTAIFKEIILLDRKAVDSELDYGAC